jgi:hypothetical protein
MSRVGIAAALIGLRIALILVVVALVPVDGSGALGNDARRFLEISRATGTPYRDFEVEFPPVSAGLTDLLAHDAGDARTLAWRLAVTMLLCEVIVTLALWHGWSDEVAVGYLLIGMPMAWFIYVRADLLSVMLAVIGLVLVRRRRITAGAAALVIGGFAKIWPVLLLPIVAVRRGWQALFAGIAAGVGGLAFWMIVYSTDGPRQVLTFRGATGWGIESTWGLQLWLVLGRPARFEQGAWRVGFIPPTVRALLAVSIVVGSVYLWSRASERTMYGAVPAAVIASTMLLSPHTSLQWVAWLLPFVAITGDRASRLWSALAAGSATGVYVAASIGGTWFAVAAACEFLRVIAIAGVLVACWRLIRADRSATWFRGVPSLSASA